MKHKLAGAKIYQSTFYTNELTQIGTHGSYNTNYVFDLYRRDIRTREITTIIYNAILELVNGNYNKS